MSFFKFLGALADRIADRISERLSPEPEPAPTLSIAEIAAGNPNFEALVRALSLTKDAGLNNLLTAAGDDSQDLTVFAPTDDAFRELAASLGIDVSGVTDDALVADAILAGLTAQGGGGPEAAAAAAQTVSDILTYHVKAGGSTKAELQGSGTVDTLLTVDDEAVTFGVAGNELKDNDPDVDNPDFVEGLTDIAATNGFIQVIDRVLLPIDVPGTVPSEAPTIAETAESAGFSILLALLGAEGVDAGLAAAASDSNADLTVFAPTNQAFLDLAGILGIEVAESVAPEAFAATLVDVLGPELVTSVLQYHILAGSKTVAELQDGKASSTLLADEALAFDGETIFDGAPGIGNANLVDGLTDLGASNGLIQVVDAVLLPIDVADVGPQKLYGNKQDNFLVGGDSVDVIHARKGDDVILSGDGNDRVKAGGGDDIVISGQGDDRVLGGSGNDTIVEGAGNDKYWGGFGVDTFDFTNFDGSNQIYGFGPFDQLIFSSNDFANVDAVLAAADDISRGVRIETEDGLASVEIRGLFDLEADQITIA